MNQSRVIPEIRITESMDGFSDLVENARGMSLAQERDLRDSSRERQGPPGSPLPSRCSSKLKMIIERQISLGQSTHEDPKSGRSSLNASPYVSPYGSPCSSPRSVIGQSRCLVTADWSV